VGTPGQAEEERGHQGEDAEAQKARWAKAKAGRQ
jgi:hypothetical protein